MSEVPLLDLAPKLNRPLSLWIPFDYLRLLYWAFYFPQAITWYVETFCESAPETNKLNWIQRWELIQNSPRKRQLAIMGMILVITIPVIICLCSYSIGIPVYLNGINGLIGGLTVAVLGQIAFTMLSDRIAFSIQSITFWIVFGISSGMGTGLLLRATYGVCLGLICRILANFGRSLALATMSGLAIGLAPNGLLGASGLETIITSVLATILAILRPDDWCFLFGRIPRNTPLRIPKLTRQLSIWLEADWQKGLVNANQLIKYSWQFFAVDIALNKSLEVTPSEILFVRLFTLSDLIEDWDTLRYTSSSLIDGLKSEFIQSMFWLPYKLWIAERWGASEDLRFDKPHRSAAAGLFHLHQAADKIAIRANSSIILKMRHAFDEKYEKGSLSFKKAIYSLEKLRSIKHGEEIYQLASTLKDLTEAISIEDILKLKPIYFPDSPELRPTTWTLLRKLESVIKDIHVLSQAKSRTARSFALNRAQGKISEILNNLEMLPANVSRIERPIIYGIAEIWKIVLDLNAYEIGQVAIDKPILNPYTIGDPVLGHRFIGREDILRQLEELWIVNVSPQSVILYGHRRMGKTSILRNVSMRLGSQVYVAYVNLLTISSSLNGITDILMAICDALEEATEIPVPNSKDLIQFPETTFRRYLQHIEKNFTGTGLIIALDEFENIEAMIDAGKLSKDFLGFLRGMVQMSSKLAFAFAGLHKLQERNSDYFQPFFSSFISIAVSFLTRDATKQVLANPDPEFLLEYEPATLDHIYDLTNGQPYLTQLIGFQLVRMFNDYVFEQGKPRDHTFTIDDVHTICSGENFFTTGINYFNGVWQQAAEGATHQHEILKSLAPHPQGLTESELISQTNLPSETLQAALKTLKDHDVIRVQKTNEMVNYAIAVKLFRTWVVRYKLSNT